MVVDFATDRAASESVPTHDGTEHVLVTDAPSEVRATDVSLFDDVVATAEYALDNALNPVVIGRRLAADPRLLRVFQDGLNRLHPFDVATNLIETLRTCVDILYHPHTTVKDPERLLQEPRETRLPAGSREELWVACHKHLNGWHQADIARHLAIGNRKTVASLVAMARHNVIGQWLSVYVPNLD